jgi:hypothetical protein
MAIPKREKRNERDRLGRDEGQRQLWGKIFMSSGERTAAAAMLGSFALGAILYFSAVAGVCACEPDISQAPPLPVETSVPKVTLKKAWMHKGGKPDKAAFSKDGTRIAILEGLHSVAIRSAADGRILGRIDDRATVIAISFGSNASVLFSGDENGAVKEWDLATFKEKTTLNFHEYPILCLCCSDDGKTVISGDMAGWIVVVDGITAKLRLREQWRESAVHCLRLTGDAKTLITGDLEGTIRVWQLDGWRLTKEFRDHSLDVYSVDLSKDGRYLASASGEKIVVRDCNASGANALKTLREWRSYSLCFSPGTMLLAVAPNRYEKEVHEDIGCMHLLDGRTGAEMAKGIEHVGGISWVAFSPDGARLACGYSDGALEVWDVVASEQRGTK